jgi:hypothetical protein
VDAALAHQRRQARGQLLLALQQRFGVVGAHQVELRGAGQRQQPADLDLLVDQRLRR